MATASTAVASTRDPQTTSESRDISRANKMLNKEAMRELIQYVFSFTQYAYKCLYFLGMSYLFSVIRVPLII